MTKVPLDLFSEQAAESKMRNKIWIPFLDHVDKMFKEKLNLSDLDAEFWNDDEFRAVCLAEYGGSTNWEDDLDPIWFDTQDDLVRFVLTFGN